MELLGQLLVDPLREAIVQRALVASVLAGLVCSVVGSYVVLKGMAFIGDAVAHAAFPGVVAAFIFGGPYVVGGGVAAFLTAISIGWVSRRARIRVDTAIGVLFAGSFALGVLMYSSIRGFVGDLMGFLLGNVLFIRPGELIALIVLGAAVLGIVALLWKELLYSTFDPQGAAASGLPVGPLEYLFLGLVAVTIVVSIQAVGIILVVAMLVTPAATAQLLTVRFSRLMGVAALIGSSTAVAGMYASYWFDVASGATIVLIQSFVFALAVLLGPRTGLLRRQSGATLEGATPAAG